MIVRPSVVLVNPLDDVQAAIDSVSPNGGVVQLGPGTYTGSWRTATANSGSGSGYKMWLQVPSNVVLRGSGAATILTIAMPGAGLVGHMIVFDAATDAGVENLTLMGTAVDEAHGTLQGVKICGASARLKVRDVTVTGDTGSSSLNNFVVITDDVAPADLGHHMIERNTIERLVGTSSSFGLGVAIGSAAYITVRDNVSVFSVSQGRHHVYLSGACTNCLVTGNTTFDGTAESIVIQNQGTSGAFSAQNTVSNNTVNGSAGIHVTLRANNNAVIGNTILSPITRGITMTGNMNTTTQTCDHNVAIGNYIYKAQQQAICVYGTIGSTLSGNVIFGANQSNASYAAIQIVYNGTTTPSFNIKVVGNTVVADPDTSGGNKKHREALLIDDATLPPGATIVVGNSFELGDVCTYINNGRGTINGSNVLSTGVEVDDHVYYEDDAVLADDIPVTYDGVITY